MKWSGLLLLASAGAWSAHAADATTPVDYTQRNGTFAPSAAIAPEARKPHVNPQLQDRRVPVQAVEKSTSSPGERRAALEVQETREKSVREKDSQRPVKTEQPASTFNQRRAAISTAEHTTKPPVVAKYQDSLAAPIPWGPGAAQGSTLRVSKTDAAATAKINRFVFRKNPSDAAGDALHGAPVTPAAGGSPVRQ